MITMYGIKNCDTIKKARKWLSENQIEYQFHDYRSDGLTRAQLTAWEAELGWESLLNRRGTTWRKLPDKTKKAIDQSLAIDLLLEHPAMIKRPLLDTGKQRVLGFTPENYSNTLI
ncbi:MAG: ArsC family reductase [Gammaproteobacteria bacterium]